MLKKIFLSFVYKSFLTQKTPSKIHLVQKRVTKSFFEPKKNHYGSI